MCRRKGKHMGLFQMRQNIGGSRDSLNGICSPEHLINDAQKGGFLLGFLQDSLQGLDLHNVVALLALQVIPKCHGSLYLKKRSGVFCGSTGIHGLRENGIHRHIF